MERYLADEPVEACPPSAGYRLRKFAAQVSHAAAGGGRVPAAAGRGRDRQHLAGHPRDRWPSGRPGERAGAQKRKDEADEAKQLAEKRRDELAAVNDNLRRANYVADMNLARVAWDENNLGRAHELLEKHRPRPGETDLRGFEWHYLRRLFQSDLLTVKAHPGGVTAVAFTPDGKRLVTSGIEPATAEDVSTRGPAM